MPSLYRPKFLTFLGNMKRASHKKELLLTKRSCWSGTEYLLSLLEVTLTALFQLKSYCSRTHSSRTPTPHWSAGNSSQCLQRSASNHLYELSSEVFFHGKINPLGSVIRTSHTRTHLQNLLPLPQTCQNQPLTPGT